MYDRTIPAHRNYTDLLNQPELWILSFKSFTEIEELQPIQGFTLKGAITCKMLRIFSAY